MATVAEQSAANSIATKQPTSEALHKSLFRGYHRDEQYRGPRSVVLPKIVRAAYYLHELTRYMPKAVYKVNQCFSCYLSNPNVESDPGNLHWHSCTVHCISQLNCSLLK